MKRTINISISQFQMNSAMIFIMISIVITFISFLTAERVYSEYTLIPYSVIFVSTFIGLEVMLYLCVVPLSELVDSWDKKRKRLTATKNFVANHPASAVPKVESPNLDKEALEKGIICKESVVKGNDGAAAVAPEVAKVANKANDTATIVNVASATDSVPIVSPFVAQVAPQTLQTPHTAPQAVSVEASSKEKPVDADIQAIYNRSEAENREMDAKIKEKKAALIKYYITDTMAPLLEKEDMEVFLIEFEQWINHSAYHPKGRNWKWKKDVNIKVSDVRHLVWNIAKRLGMDKGYNTETCAEFIKNMFPDICQEVKKSTLSQTLTADPDKGYIKLDRPDDKDSFRFHN